MRNSDAKTIFQLSEKVFPIPAFHLKPGFHHFRAMSIFQRIQLIQVNVISFSCDVVMQIKTQHIESLYMVFSWFFAFARRGRGDVFNEVRCLCDVFNKIFRTSSGKRLGKVLKTGRRDFHFRPIYDVFAIKIKMFL